MSLLNFFKSDKILTKKEMSKVKGSGGGCGVYYPLTGGGYVKSCNVSYSTASSMGSKPGAYWCCSSCGSSSYCG